MWYVCTKNYFNDAHLNRRFWGFVVAVDWVVVDFNSFLAVSTAFNGFWGFVVVVDWVVDIVVSGGLDICFAGRNRQIFIGVTASIVDGRIGKKYILQTIEPCDFLGSWKNHISNIEGR